MDSKKPSMFAPPRHVRGGGSPMTDQTTLEQRSMPLPDLPEGDWLLFEDSPVYVVAVNSANAMQVTAEEALKQSLALVVCSSSGGVYARWATVEDFHHPWRFILNCGMLLGNIRAWQEGQAGR